jgi:aspartate racemase
MATLGLIGGLGPETTIEYYRLLIEGYREKKGGTYPSIIINSVDLKRLIAWMGNNELDKVTDYLSAEIERLHQAGANVAALASNTPHIVFDELQQRSKIPLVSIVESASLKAQSLNLKTVGLIGTRYTMKAGFYPNVFSGKGIKLVTPNDAEQAFIHDKYMNELLNNLFLPGTRDQILAIVDELKAREGVEAVVLGGTELPLLLRTAENNQVLLFDTAKIHVDALMERMLT